MIARQLDQRLRVLREKALQLDVYVALHDAATLGIEKRHLNEYIRVFTRLLRCLPALVQVDQP